MDFHSVLIIQSNILVGESGRVRMINAEVTFQKDKNH